jgi:hypothetical protein
VTIEQTVDQWIAVPEVSVTRRFIHVRFTTFGVMGIWRGGSAGEVDKE